MVFFLKKISYYIPGSLFPALITIYISLRKRIDNYFFFNKKHKLKINSKKSLQVLDIDEFKKMNLKKPFFILGCGTTINELSNKEKKFIESSTSVGINYFILSDIKPKFYTWQRPADQDGLNLYLEILASKRKKFVDQGSNLILHSPFSKAGYKTKELLKYFDKVKIYHSPRIFYGNKNKFKNIYKYLFHPLFLKVLGRSMVYGLHSTVDNLTHLAISAGYREIVFAGVDLNNSRYFFDEFRLEKKIIQKLKKNREVDGFGKVIKNKNQQHLTERKVGFIPVSEIINVLYKFASTKGIKFYTTSKKSKLSLFLPQYKFPKVGD